MDRAVQPLFEATHQDGDARTGRMVVYRKGVALTPVHTPCLFPVVNLMTGTTPRGGGIWKYILRSLFAGAVPMMTQALQFLDFSLTPKELGAWMTHPDGSALDRYVRHYAADIPELGVTEYNAPLFLDSGGYKFLSNRNLDLTPYGIRTGSDAWRGILDIQKSIGGDIYVSLDYPIKPGLHDAEAVELISQSIENAMLTRTALMKGIEPNPPLYVPCHGRTYEEIKGTLERLFERLGPGSIGDNIGVGVGSLVPLRSSHRFEDIIGIIRGARAGLLQQAKERVPIHAFGITGNMIPVLSFLGVDTFDSSSYVQNARTLGYFHPVKNFKVSFLEMEDDKLPCECPACRRSSHRDMHSTLVNATNGQPHNGKFKSEVYASIALHNLYWDNQVVLETRKAIEDGNLEAYLVEHARRFPTVRPVVEHLATGRTGMKAALSREYHVMNLQQKNNPSIHTGPLDLLAYNPGPPPWQQSEGARSINAARTDICRRISLKYTPDSFGVPASWAPNPQKDVLLILPCSDAKPYRDSRTHQAVLTYLSERLGSISRIQKVTLSGLYGPVPEEFEEQREVLEYDFHLHTADEIQITLCAKRLAEFLLRHSEQYIVQIGYVTSRAYREVIERTALTAKGITLLPQRPVKQQLTELFRREHLESLAACIEREVMVHDRRIAN